MDSTFEKTATEIVCNFVWVVGERSSRACYEICAVDRLGYLIPGWERHFNATVSLSYVKHEKDN